VVVTEQRERERERERRESEGVMGGMLVGGRRKEEEDSRAWRGEDMTQHDITIAC